MDLSLFWDPEISRHLILSAVLGAVIGLERELAGKDPSLRTFSLICMGSCIFALMSRYVAQTVPGADPGRIAAQIVPGIGFLGAGAIFKSTRGVSGITTATLMWITAAIGTAVGFDKFPLAVSATLVALAAIYSLRLVHMLLSYVRAKSGVKEAEIGTGS
ncbi:MAG: MgtC/SapB family protein [Oligoflexia bacterium]|nr:MgtC/SapB family protein [Oligoflexia bacterium]